ncbi:MULTISPECIES: AMP-binding protein [Rhodococcus]|uniref:acetate--CoA ligase n=1 Tax=Rhodococcus opacus RKJ300 = JCM 13270 TaxID=1165867 RepID=I0WKX3_RHOOP|nr:MULTISPECIES: AMP-binding protein [Rhodococcus]EID77039.1 acetate--CoA ligase [Rhodococcus opacus RKJ300 = JCM 13270]QQZ18799.1 AMP-binding protein [Rhodococcus sp. 21391]
MSDYTWRPTDEYVENANVTRLARAHGLSGLGELRARSVADVRWYWDAVVRDLGLPFRSPYREVLDTSRGIEYPEWFVGGTSNVVDACLEQWLADPAVADRTAVAHEAEDGTVRSLSYRELATDVERAAAGLRELGVGKGDAVALYLPMIPEAVVSVYAIARLGAVLVPLFSGFAPSAIASRIQDADAKVVIVADGTVRRRKSVTMKPALDEALASCPTVQSVVVVENVGVPVDSTDRDISWGKLLGNGGDPGPVEAMDAGEPFALAYTSGTTGKPKGAVHTHAGFLVKTASEVAYSFDLKPGGVFCWITDMGWIMGPLSIIGTHANGGTLVLYEGSPDVPDTDRLWQLAQRHRVTMLGVSPTLIRTLRGRDTDVAARYDLSSVHTIGSTGEPWDPDSYEWLARDVFGGRVPIINFSGGTEVGGSFLAPYPVEPIRSCSLGGPSLGMDVDVVDDAGRSLRGEQGELVCRQPWPSMTRGVWKDEERYLEAYWSTFPGMWRHGDYALVDDDGQWYIRGRSDDVMNVAGKRLAPAEVEAVLTAHPAVSEAAAVGVPDPKKGEAVWAFWVPRADADATDISAELVASVAAELGKPFAPSAVHRVSRLPKTRSAKILRRAVRAAALDIDPGDLSGAENPEAVDEIRAVVAGASAEAS